MRSCFRRHIFAILSLLFHARLNPVVLPRIDAGPAQHQEARALDSGEFRQRVGEALAENGHLRVRARQRRRHDVGARSIAQAKVSGSRAATQIGGCGFCNGFGTDVARGKRQTSPLCSNIALPQPRSTGSISRRYRPPSRWSIPPAIRSNSYWNAPRPRPSSSRPSLKTIDQRRLARNADGMPIGRHHHCRTQTNTRGVRRPVHQEGERIRPGHQLDCVVLRRPGNLEATLPPPLHQFPHLPDDLARVLAGRGARHVDGDRELHCSPAPLVTSRRNSQARFPRANARAGNRLSSESPCPAPRPGCCDADWAGSPAGILRSARA